MEDSFFLVSALLGRCPSCLYNFKKVFCELTCSPDQSDFLTVNKVKEQNASAINVDGAALVTGLEFRVTREFGDGVFASCKVKNFKDILIL